MPIKMNAAQTRKLEAKLAGFINDITTSPDQQTMRLAKAKAEGALEGMSEMGYPALSAEAQHNRIDTAARKAARALNLLARTQIA